MYELVDAFVNHLSFYFLSQSADELIHTDNPSTDILDLNSVLLFVAIYVQ